MRDRSDSDIGRVRRQQKFLKAVVDESLSYKLISQGPQLLAALGENLNTNMPAREIMRVANTFLNVDIENIAQGVIPGKGQTISGVSYWVPDIAKTQELLKELGLVMEPVTIGGGIVE